MRKWLGWAQVISSSVKVKLVFCDMNYGSYVLTDAFAIILSTKHVYRRYSVCNEVDILCTFLRKRKGNPLTGFIVSSHC